MKVIHTIASTRLDHGGTSRSVPATCDALADAGVETHLLTARPADTSIQCNSPRDADRVHWARESKRIRQWGVSRQFREMLTRLVADCDQPPIVHDHAIWLATNHAVARFCRENQILRVVSPRGMMGDWAMAHGGMKKRLAWHFYQRRDLESADAFHCTSELEAEEVRKLGFRQPIEVIPNGITRPACLPERHERSGRRALFLSRIHPKKGLLNLVRAWKQANVSRDWKLMIAGPDESGHQAEVEAEVRSLGLTDQVEFPGPISDDRKWQYYVDGDLFVLPSFSENFGIVIAEAMAAGLPVIATTGTPWSVLNERGLGWWMEPTVESLSAAIAEACAQDLAALRKRGAFARKFAIAQFSWTDVAQRLKLFYENTLGSR